MTRPSPSIRSRATAGQAVLRAVADALLTAELTGTPIASPTESHPELTVDDGYAIQLINRESRTWSGARIVGYKIGLSSQAMQDALGVTEPDYGHIYHDRVIEDRGTLDSHRLIAPRVEPEVAFVLGGDLAGPNLRAEDVLAATDHVRPALEVIDSRIADWKIGLIDTIADNASFARIVLGTQRTSPVGVDLAATTVQLRVDGEVVHEGSGAAVLGHPANAVAWLANRLSRYGVTLRAGAVVLSGSLTAPVPLDAGATVAAEFDVLGRVELSAQ